MRALTAGERVCLLAGIAAAAVAGAGVLFLFGPLTSSFAWAVLAVASLCGG